MDEVVHLSHLSGTYGKLKALAVLFSGYSYPRFEFKTKILTFKKYVSAFLRLISLVAS